MGYKYAYQKAAENTARAVGTDIAVSTKSSIMVANFVRGKTVSRAQRDLGLVLEKRMAVPFTRFTEGAGHKPGGVGPGKYPKKAAENFLRVINSAAANALDKGLDENLIISSVTVHQAARPMRYGRIRGRQRKGTHIEVIVAQAPPQAEKKTVKKAAKKAAPKAAKPAPAKKAPETEKQAKPAKPTEKKSAAKEAAKPATPKKEAKESKE